MRSRHMLTILNTGLRPNFPCGLYPSPTQMLAQLPTQLKWRFQRRRPQHLFSIQQSSRPPTVPILIHLWWCSLATVATSRRAESSKCSAVDTITSPSTCIEQEMKSSSPLEQCFTCTATGCWPQSGIFFTDFSGPILSPSIQTECFGPDSPNSGSFLLQKLGPYSPKCGLKVTEAGVQCGSDAIV